MTDQPPQGFQMSGKRTVVETALVVAVILLVVIGLIALVRFGAGALTNLVPISVDRKLGEQSARAVQATSSPCTDPGPVTYVETIAAPLLRALGDDRFTFQFVVVDDDEVNAFALPGGFVTVNMGLLENAKAGEEVAAVLAHELQHVVLRHGTRRILRELGTSALLGALFGGTDIAVPASVVRDVVSRAYDRSEESDADSGGLDLMVRAGVDPRGMATFFERLAKSSVAPPAIISTHPDPGDRAERAASAGKKVNATQRLPLPAGLHCK
jgi:predicted Zn-dependent protease